MKIAINALFFFFFFYRRLHALAGSSSEFVLKHFGRTPWTGDRPSSKCLNKHKHKPHAVTHTAQQDESLCAIWIVIRTDVNSL